MQKSDGGFNYTTTDLATLQFRLEGGPGQRDPDEIIYVTDGRQQLHFKQLFTLFRRWRPEARVKLAHVWFGSILGEDGAVKTRSGDTLRLEDLLDEAEERALKVVSEKNPELSRRSNKIARVVGLGAIKYADLSQNRQSDYLFSWDKMLSLQGNTAPYLLYAYTRVRSIFRKGGEPVPGGAGTEIVLEAAEEMALARHLLNFGLALEGAAEDYRPIFYARIFTNWRDTSRDFMKTVPCSKPRGFRALASGLVRSDCAVLKQGLEVLGIETTEQM